MPKTTEQTLHILLLDDHALFRESVARLLSVEPGFDVVAHCGTIEEARSSDQQAESVQGNLSKSEAECDPSKCKQSGDGRVQEDNA